VSTYLQPLSEGGTIDEMPGWEFIHVPGHTPGQIALWREADRLLVSADAVITTAQESAYAVLTQEPELHGPPKYFTTDWQAAAESVRKLESLRPEILLSMHGRPLAGPHMRAAFRSLATRFEEVAVPEHGIYADESRTTGDGSAYAG
jgi:glyoxylase-like metal-dependent hydrolase (beta-lactamase superfamily II)